MKSLCFFCFAFILASSAFSMEKVPIKVNPNITNTIVKGAVRDKLTSQPVAYAKVYLFRKGKVTFRGYTDYNGQYFIKKPLLGHYDLKVFKGGYKQEKVYKYFHYREEYQVDFLLERELTEYPPERGVIVPDSGTFGVSQPVIFSTVCKDRNGYEDIYFVDFLIKASSSAACGAELRYDAVRNKLYLRNVVYGSLWRKGFSPSSGGKIENSYLWLDCAKTTVSVSGDTLTVNWNVGFKNSFLGGKNLSLCVKDKKLRESKVSKYNTIFIDGTPPVVPEVDRIEVLSDKNNCMLYGTKERFSSIWINNQEAVGNNDRVVWEAKAALPMEGRNKFVLFSRDKFGNSSVYVEIIVIRDTTPPKAQAGADRVVAEDVEVIFNAGESWDNIGIEDFLWNFGDETSGEGVTTKHTYSAPGKYTVTLTVTDSENNTATDTLIVVVEDVTAPEPPVMNKVTSPTNQSPQTLSGTKENNTSLWINNQEIISLNIQTDWQLTVELTEGNNVFNISVKDQAENESSRVPITIELNSGKLAEPDEETVIESGGVRLIIPPGALDEPTQISMWTINNAELAGKIPEETTILKAVECQPYAQDFNIPVSIIYTLDTYENPGTDIQLALFYRDSDSINITQISQVKPDGYTVEFSLMHFSTYAALKSLVPSSAPIGGGVQIPLPDMFTGAYSHAVPITIPPGRLGMQPNVSLTYRSSNANSWLGVGFDLNPGYIVRSTKLGPPKYRDIEDTFYFVSDGGTTELVHLIDNLYQAKIESSFNKFFKETNDTWRVIGKDGSELLFGQDTGSKEISPKGTYRWYLTKVRDTNGNYIKYSYTQDRGKSYLQSIGYTGNEIGLSPTKTIEFFLEDREDISSNYISTSKIATAKRLDEIIVKVNGNQVWTYKLEYDYSPDTRRSLLKTLRQFAYDGKELPAQSFVYQRAE